MNQTHKIAIYNEAINLTVSNDNTLELETKVFSDDFLSPPRHSDSIMTHEERCFSLQCIADVSFQNSFPGGRDTAGSRSVPFILLLPQPTNQISAPEHN